MELTVARSIINTAIEGDYGVEMPEDNDGVFELAKILYEYALKEKQPDTYISEIIALGNSSSEQIGVVEKIAKKHGLSVPPELKGEVVELPKDLTTVDDLSLRRLYSIFGAYLSRAKVLLTNENSALANATHLRDDAYRKALSNVDRVDSDTGKSKLKEILDIEAKENKNFQKWDSLVREHTDTAAALKTLAEIYASNCDRISREATMRQHEWERSR